jgi:hypothetical protein
MNELVPIKHLPGKICVLLPLLVIAVAGCGGKTQMQVNCGVALQLSVAPQSATADHAAASPGNKTSYVAADAPPPGCIPTPGPLRTDLKWSVSDTVNTTIGNTPKVDYGVATCINATPSPVTVTAAGPNSLGATITGTATLTCK